MSTVATYRKDPSTLAWVPVPNSEWTEPVRNVFPPAPEQDESEEQELMPLPRTFTGLPDRYSPDDDEDILPPPPPTTPARNCRHTENAAYLPVTVPLLEEPETFCYERDGETVNLRGPLCLVTEVGAELLANGYKLIDNPYVDPNLLLIPTTNESNSTTMTLTTDDGRSVVLIGSASLLRELYGSLKSIRPWAYQNPSQQMPMGWSGVQPTDLSQIKIVP